MEKVISKKILPEYFAEVRAGRKNFEIRKDEDNVRTGDLLILEEYDPADGERTGRQTIRRVTYVLRHVPEYGLMPGYCIIGF